MIKEDELRAALKQAGATSNWSGEGVRINDEQEAQSSLRAEPITITLLSAAAVVALVRGLLNIINTHVAARGAQKIVFTDTEGGKMEFPASIPPEKILEYAEINQIMRREREIKRIELL
ncbi:hypothetical protein ACG10_22715 (plasmid) [Azotobacter chroococcum]|nr:hypothetical protein ACG10_22715 [Azotobacter chroococcum]